jgi:hypothetical protein
VTAGYSIKGDVMVGDGGRERIEIFRDAVCDALTVSVLSKTVMLLYGLRIRFGQPCVLVRTHLSSYCCKILN